MKKRILSILLALCLALSLLPTLAFGQETVGQAATEAELTAALADSANDVVRLTADITITAGLKVQHNVTVDLNGCVLRYDETAAPDSIFRVAGGKTLTMTDSRPAAEHEDETLPVGGLITGGKAERGGGVYVDGGTFTMNGGNIAGCTARLGGGVYVDGGTFTMTDGSIVGCTAKTQNDATRGGGICNFGTLALSGDAEIRDCHAVSSGGSYEGGGIYSAGTSLTISGNVKITGCTADRISGAMYAGADRAQRTFQITGGTFDGLVYFNNKSNTPVTGGTFKALVINEYGTINGGTFYGEVTNNDTITGGTFHGTVTNKAGVGQHTQGKITGGVFYGQVTNEATDVVDGEPGEITGGVFYGPVTNEASTEVPGSKPGKITGGTFYGELVNNGTISGCTVTYKYGDLGGIYAEQIVQKGETAIRPTEPKMNGFTFCGWYTDAGCTDESKYDFTAPVTGNITLYAKWEGTFYGIRITDKDGEVYYVTDKNADDVLGDGTVVYTPGDWNEAEIPNEYWADAAHTTFTQEAWEKLMAGEEIPGIHFPKLTLNGAELQEIAARCGWGADPQTRTLNTFLRLELVGKNAISNAEERGAGIYCPLGMNLLVSGDGSLDVTADCAISTEGGLFCQRGGEVTLSARRMGIAHSYSHYLRFYGGKLTIQVTSTESNNDYGALPFYNSDETFQIMDGAAFRVGNSAEDNVLITPPSSGEFKPDDIFDQLEGKVTTSRPYYLSLTANYTVTFDTDGAGTVDTQTVPYGGRVTKPVTPTRTGHTFGGWYLGEEEYDFTAPVTENLALAVFWFTDLYTITFDSAGGTPIMPITQDYGVAISAPADPQKTGYVFAGWDQEFPATMPARDLTLTARWTLCTHMGSATHPTCTKGSTCTLCGETLPAAGHDYTWQSGGGLYWQQCSICTQETAKKPIPQLTISGADRVCRTQDYTFSFTLPQGCQDPTYGYDFMGLLGDGGLEADLKDGVYSAAIRTDSYYTAAGFQVMVSAQTEDGFVFTVTKDVAIVDGHQGGTATCTDQAVCEICGERYGDLDAGHHGDLRHVPARAATTDAEGNIEYWYCGGCHKYYADAAATREITQADTVTAKLPAPVIPSAPETPSIPSTGDGGAALWITLLLVSGVLAGMAVTKKRKHSKNA